MTVKNEIKSQLAKLLATEDLIVEHKRVETAQFDVHSRVLTLPVWDASEYVYDLLVSHEVGHALYTPDRNWILEDGYQINPQFVNIVEDARIEKLMKRRYEGISKTFYRGYTDLVDQDFFQVDNKDVSEMNLADRINLHYKIGTHLDIPFTLEESIFVKKIDNCETFDEVLDISKELFEYCKEQFEKEKQEQEVDDESGMPVEGMPDGQGQTSGNFPFNDADDSQEGETDDGQPTPQEPVSKESQSVEDQPSPTGDPVGGTEGGNVQDELTVETADNLEDALRNLVQMEGRDNVYIEVPQVDLNTIIVSNKEIHDEIQALHAEIKPPVRPNNPSNDERLSYQFEMLTNQYEQGLQMEKNFAQFKKSAQKEVNYLVKEFECKKSASAYARATTSRTGVLDTTKLHTYKYNEDLFKKISVLPDGKNHGLVFILDWSGSMSHIMLDTIKQLYNLMWFCKKVQIPFEVYAFTSSHPNINGRDEEGQSQYAYEPKDGQVQVERGFSLMNLFTSKSRGKDLNQQMLNIFKVVSSFRGYSSGHFIPNGLNLSGTPLNEAIVSLHQIIPQFQKESGVEKVNCVILTDGEAQWSNYHREVQRGWEDKPYMGTGSLGEGVFLRNRKTGKSHEFDGYWAGVTSTFLTDIGDTFPHCNFIGIRILESREGGRFIRTNFLRDEDNPLFVKKMSEWKRNKSVVLEGGNQGYKVYLGLSSSAIGNDSEFQVKEDASKADIKRAFTKSLKGKKMNKKILSKFIEQIA